jgi:lysyl-tRNA synthetase class II
MRSFTEQENIRRKKVVDNQTQGISNYLTKQEITNTVSDLNTNFVSFTKEQLEEKTMIVSS